MYEYFEAVMSLFDDDDDEDYDFFDDKPICNTDAYPCWQCDYSVYSHGHLRCSKGKCAFF